MSKEFEICEVDYLDREDLMFIQHGDDQYIHACEITKMVNAINEDIKEHFLKLEGKTCPDEVFHQEGGLVCSKTLEINKLQAEIDKERYDHADCLLRLASDDKLIKENQDLKAFVREACDLVRFYGQVANYNNQPKQGEIYPIEFDNGKRARQFMNTDKYKEYGNA